MTDERKIEFQQTRIIIYNYKEESNYLKFLSRLSVWDKNNRTKNSFVTDIAYIIKDNDLIIHRGIKPSTLNYYFPNHYTNYDNIANPYKNIPNGGITCNTEPRDILQVNIIQFLKNNKDSQKFVCAKPGCGKTYTTIKYICDTGIIPIIIVDNDKILAQWKDSFLKFSDIKEEDIFIISGSPTIKKLFKEKDNPYKVYLASHRTLQSYCDDDYTQIDNLFSKLGIGIKVFDEAHVEWMNIFNIDCNTNIKYTIYLTATPGRSKPSENSVYEQMFGNINMYGFEESREEKYIYYIDYLWNSHPTKYDIDHMSTTKGFDLNGYNNYIVTDKFDQFSDFIKDIIIRMYAKNQDLGKIAVVVNCNNLIDILYNDLSKTFSDKSIGRFSMLVDKKNREAELDKDIILTTVRGFNKGVDVKGLDILINTTNIGSSVLIEQLSGRLRYENGVKKYFIQLTDEGFPQFIYNDKLREKHMSNIYLKSWKLSYNSNKK